MQGGCTHLVQVTPRQLQIAPIFKRPKHRGIEQEPQHDHVAHDAVQRVPPWTLEHFHAAVAVVALDVLETRLDSEAA